MTVWSSSARTGMPARLRGASQRRAGMSSPIVCTMRGPAKIMELMVETSRAAMTPPIKPATQGAKKRSSGHKADFYLAAQPSQRRGAEEHIVQPYI